MVSKKDAAKVLTGAAGLEVINHAVLAQSNLLPMNFLGYTITATINFVLLGGWLVVLIFSIYYGWFKD